MSQLIGRNRSLALMAPVGATLFTLAWLVLGFVSPGYQMFDIVIEEYSSVSQPISGLGLGETGPWMNAAFIIGGLLMTMGVVGIGRAWPVGERPRSRKAALSLMGACGVGMALCGVFTFESVMLHLLGFALAVLLPPVGFIVAAYSLRHTRPQVSNWLYATGSLALILLVVFQVIFDPYAAGDNVGVAGLMQRALVIVVLGTIATLGATRTLTDG